MISVIVDHAATKREQATPPDGVTRVLVVYPGHAFSTLDVADNIVAGCRALGVDTLPYLYHDHIHTLVPWGRALETAGFDASDARQQVLMQASHGVFPRALAFRPDLILVVTGHVFPPAAAGLLGQYTRTACVLTEAPYQWETERVTQGYYPIVFTNERRSVATLRAERLASGHPRPESVYYLPHGYDPERHRPRPADAAYASDVCFIGSPFPERQALMRGVDWSGIRLVTRGLWSDPDDLDSVTGARGFISNAETQRYYASAAIVINHHRETRYYGLDERIAPGAAESINPRAYEVAAAGVFQICDDSRPELGEVFGDTVPTYRQGDSADLERVIRHWLARPADRARLAAAARERVAPHTVANRMRFALDQCLASRETNEQE